jgi:phosphatidate cytidylyltransferase
MPKNTGTILFFCILLGLLIACGFVGWILHVVIKGVPGRTLVRMVNARIRVWWKMAFVLAAAMLAGATGSLAVFGVTSFLLLREFVTITPTRRGDHHALFYVFLVIPVQYCLLAVNWYGLFVILIPVYAFLLIPARIVAAGDACGFLERAAKIQWALMLCVYCISHAPALLRLHFEGDGGMGIRLLVYLVIVIQTGNMVHLVFDRMIGRHKLIPKIHDELSLEGFVICIVLSVIVGASLWWATPFSMWQSAVMSLIISLMGYFGELCLAAIKKDRGKESVVVVETHVSIMDHVISLCFAAPIFFHLTRYFFLSGRRAMF